MTESEYIRSLSDEGLVDYLIRFLYDVTELGGDTDGNGRQRMIDCMKEPHID
jgi:hypothetical protein